MRDDRDISNMTMGQIQSIVDRSFEKAEEGYYKGKIQELQEAFKALETQYTLNIESDVNKETNKSKLEALKDIRELVKF